MRISHFFIDRPIFAAVVSIVFIILGAVAFARLPIAQYPEIAPPIINVTGQYPGASAEVVATTVVAPIEEQINGVENMLYCRLELDRRRPLHHLRDLRSRHQSRYRAGAGAESRRHRAAAAARGGAQHRRHRQQELARPDDGRAPLFRPTSRATRCSSRTMRRWRSRTLLTRIDGVGSITVFGSRDYAMRVWLDPHRLQSLGLTAGDVTLALQGQNVQVAGGVLNQPPVAEPGAFQVAVKTLGRLADPRRVREHRGQAGAECGGAPARRRQGRARGAGLFVEFLSQRRARRRARGISAAGLQRAFDRSGHSRHHGAAFQALSARPRVHDHL